jgi:hypothetical protein
MNFTPLSMQSFSMMMPMAVRAQSTEGAHVLSGFSSFHCSQVSSVTSTGRPFPLAMLFFTGLTGCSSEFDSPESLTSLSNFLLGAAGLGVLLFIRMLIIYQRDTQVRNMMRQYEELKAEGDSSGACYVGGLLIDVARKHPERFKGIDLDHLRHNRNFDDISPEIFRILNLDQRTDKVDRT